MNKTITVLKQALGTGLGIRTNKYRLYLPVSLGRKMDVLCNAVSLPQKTIGTVDTWKYGRKYVQRAETAFDTEWTVTFYDDSEMQIRKLIESWMKEIDNTSGVSSGSALGFEREIIIKQLSQDLQEVHGYRMQNVYPISVGTIDYSDAETDTLANCEVTFAFSEFEVL